MLRLFLLFCAAHSVERRADGLLCRSQGNGPDRNYHPVASGHHSCKCAARNAVPNAAVTRQDGSGLRPQTEPETILVFLSLKRNVLYLIHMHFRGDIQTPGQWRERRTKQKEQLIVVEHERRKTKRAALLFGNFCHVL